MLILRDPLITLQRKLWACAFPFPCSETFSYLKSLLLRRIWQHLPKPWELARIVEINKSVKSSGKGNLTSTDLLFWKDLEHLANPSEKSGQIHVDVLFNQPHIVPETTMHREISQIKFGNCFWTNNCDKLHAMLLLASAGQAPRSI